MLGLGLGLARVSLNRFLLSPLTVNPNIPHCSMPFLQQTLTVPLGINKVILILNLLPIFQVTVLLRSESPQHFYRLILSFSVPQVTLLKWISDNTRQKTKLPFNEMAFGGLLFCFVQDFIDQIYIFWEYLG